MPTQAWVWHHFLFFVIFVLFVVNSVGAQPAAFDFPLWSVTPFICLLFAIAVVPVLAGHWWHRNRNRAIVTALIAGPVAVYLLYLQLVFDRPTIPLLIHEIDNYFSFIVLLGSLYTVSGGIVLRGNFRPTPLTNAAFLALGAALANVIGTTGASVLLVRPMLRINQGRLHTAHLAVFFIF